MILSIYDKAYILRHNLRTIGTLKYIGRNGDDLNATPQGHATSSLNVIFAIKLSIVWVFWVWGTFLLLKRTWNQKSIWFHISFNRSTTIIRVYIPVEKVSGRDVQVARTSKQRTLVCTNMFEKKIEINAAAIKKIIKNVYFLTEFSSYPHDFSQVVPYFACSLNNCRSFRLHNNFIIL